MKVLKIGFSGSSGTGKSTISRLLLEKIPNSIGIESMARKALSAGMTIETDVSATTPQTQSWIFFSRMAEEQRLILEAQKTGKNVLILERTILDEVAYTMAKSNDRKLAPKEQHEFFDVGIQLEKVLPIYLYTYDIIFYFPFEGYVEPDGIRPTSKSLNMFVDHYIQNNLLPANSYKIPIIIGKKEEQIRKRTEFVFDMIQRHSPDVVKNESSNPLV